MANSAELADSVLLAAASIPPGSVSTYGDVGRVVGCGPRLVARILATQGGGTSWWRVVRADGSIAEPLVSEATRHLAAEGIVVRDGHVDLPALRADLG
ncbi:MAG TPA: MGMT family protein [Propionicimonas sp.]|nr:MGMT family protein [Propionicimonas sp.]